MSSVLVNVIIILTVLSNMMCQKDNEDSGSSGEQGLQDASDERWSWTDWKVGCNSKTGWSSILDPISSLILYNLVELVLLCDTLQLKGPGAELSRRVHNLVSISRARANTGELNGSIYIPGSAKIREQSLADLQEVRKTWRVVCM